MSLETENDENVLKVRFICSVTGYPRPSILWEKGESQIATKEANLSLSNSNFSSIENVKMKSKKRSQLSTLDINLERHFANEPIAYRCFANNSEGSALKTLTVNAKGNYRT